MSLFVLILHVIGASILLGTSIVSIVIVFTKTLTKDLLQFIKLVKALVPAAAIAQLITGMYLFMAERKEYEGLWQFSLKLALYFASGILGSIILQKKIRTYADGYAPHAKMIKLLMAIDLVILLAISTIGVWLVEKP